MGLMEIRKTGHRKSKQKNKRHECTAMELSATVI
jgi:hypothetical protein